MKKNSSVGTGDLFNQTQSDSGQKKVQPWSKAETRDWILEKTGRRSSTAFDFLKLITGNGLSPYQKRFTKKI